MRPKVIINCAMSADGKIASRLRKQVRLSDESDMARVHRLRNSCDAILVGIGTVIADDPSLLVKEKYVDNPRQPIRIVLDPKCAVPPIAKVLDGKARTIIFVTEGNLRTVKGAEVIECGKEGIDLHRMLGKLKDFGVETVLVEGGGRTIWSFVKARLFDEFKVFISSKLIGGMAAPTPVDGEGFADENEFTELKLAKTTLSDSGILLEFEVE
uniref:2,5-diamino-6-(ribosylamino)-4(3H)-pyrimidinone 5'-phosphate reductase n=1 Tax=uncultured Thermoplasmata archaeon TaxID=376542 RepID=A0A871Y6Z6_9ARCH|nr:2,5-diamino-6-ribosylamino-4(3H)-pyrimidinone 5'-phosphate reductase [uncultured Thermoplasmata archaeon]